MLAKAYMYRYSQKWAGTQSNSNMNEDRGAESTDLDKAIYYASSVCHFGEQSGSGSLHELATDYSDLWRFDPKTGVLHQMTMQVRKYYLVFSSLPTTFLTIKSYCYE